MGAKNGDTVKVHYTGRLEDGTIFDTTEGRGPLEMNIGEGTVIPGFENAVVGMTPGEERTITVSPEEGFGPKREELVLKVSEGEFPEDVTPAPGQALQLRLPTGHQMNVVVEDISDGEVTLDANHPLAGHTLVFDIRLLELG